jgi:hypothetical protein
MSYFLAVYFLCDEGIGGLMVCTAYVYSQSIKPLA